LIIDTHSHLGSKDLVAYPRAAASVILDGSQDLSAERFVAEMDEAGVDGACAVQSFGLYGYDNAYHADSAQAHRDRFIGVAGLDPKAPDAPERLAYWVAERGMAGVRLTYWGAGTVLDPADARLLAVMKEADRLGVPVMFLTSRRHLAAIKTLAARFGGLRLAVDHMGVVLGDPARVESDVLSLAEAPNVTFKFSTPLLEAGEPHKSFFRRMVERIGVERLMWGSDYPHTITGGYANMVDIAREALGFMTPAERERAFSGTALSIWPQFKGAKASQTIP
jgi:L-fuconolactonase